VDLLVLYYFLKDVQCLHIYKIYKKQHIRSSDIYCIIQANGKHI
jgi:hypothetical protein